MNYKVRDQKTKKELTFEQKQVFLKLLAAHGPKRVCKNWADKTLKAYYKAQKDFEEIYGIKPEAVYIRRNYNGR